MCQAASVGEGLGLSPMRSLTLRSWTTLRSGSYACQQPTSAAFSDHCAFLAEFG